MKKTSPAFTLGIEEEYLLVDKETRSLVIDPPKELQQECEGLAEGQVTSELLRSQIEIGTKVCNNIQEAREDLGRLRRIIIDVADKYNCAPIAASTHPFSSWTEQKQTQKDRYEALTAEMQGAARRLVICGMHVHVGIEENELRIDLMNQFSYFLPSILITTKGRHKPHRVKKIILFSFGHKHFIIYLIPKYQVSDMAFWRLFKSEECFIGSF